MRAFYFFLGSKRVSVQSAQGADLLNVCMKYGYPYYQMGERDGAVFIECSSLTAHRVCRKCREIGLYPKSEALLGAPELAKRFFSRLGLVFGFILAVNIFCASQNYLWDIRITQYGGVDEEKVIETLRDCGFFRGCSLRNFSPDAIENLFLRSTDEVGWISVNMKGTVAYVEVTRRDTRPEDGPKKPANVVAACDGVVLETLTYNGLRTVKVGEFVREGQLLISGAYGEKTPGLHVTRAAGRVMARTFRTVSVEIPLEYDEKVETGRTFSEKSLIFFGKEIKVFSNSGNLGASCDKIVSGEVCTFFGADIPIEIKTENYIEYETVKRTRDPAEAEALARAELKKQIDALSPETVVAQNVKTEISGEKLLLVCELVCIENIAKTVEFTVNFRD